MSIRPYIWYINYKTIVGPINGALALLKAHKYSSGLNVATAHRAESWSWSTYSHLGGDLGPYRLLAVRKLRKLERALRDFDFESATNTEDGYTAAMRYYNNSI